MRTVQRDSGPIIVSGRIVDAVSGSGVAQPGLPFTFTRTATGTYSVQFDPRIVAVSAEVTADATGGGIWARAWNVQAGSFGIYTAVTGSGTLTNAGCCFQITALDKRT